MRAEDLGYPPVGEIRRRREALERKRAQEIREGAERLARGERPPCRRMTERHRARISDAVLARYFDVVMSDPAAPPLRKLRAVEQLSAAALAEKANIGVRSVFRAEAGDPVSARTWARLADALGVEPNQIKP